MCFEPEWKEKHTLYECLPECENPHCNYCCGGLSLCIKCGGAEGAMPTNCPGRRMNAFEVDEVYAERLDFQAGMWVDVPQERPSAVHNADL